MLLKQKFAKAVALLLVSFLAAGAKGQGFLRTEGKKIVDEKGENVLLRGMGLGGWMLQEGYMLRIHEEGQQGKIRSRIKELIGEEETQGFYNAWLENHTRKIDIDSMKAWGFNSVRLPMHYNLYTLPIELEPVPGKNTWLEKGFRMTDSLLSWCKANGMYLILDLHAAPGGQGNDLNISDGDTTKPSLWESEDNRQKTIALWKELARRYAHEPWIGGYDILNEPNWGFEDQANDRHGLTEQKNEPLKKLLMAITTAIREVDQRHMIIIEGNGWGNNYRGMLPTWDPNMVLSFHKYWNHNTNASIQHILDTRDKYNVPVWLGETGENSNVWFTEAIRLLESHNIGWAWWPLKKMGSNNPLQILSNPEYEKILAYWSGKGAKPGRDEAHKGLMELASSVKFENAVIKRDVIDALFRQPFSKKTIPFTSNQIADGSVLYAVNYDLGSNGNAYFDTDTADYHISGGGNGGNLGRTYRNDGVDIRSDSSAKEKYYVFNTAAGEWLQYTILVSQKGVYTINLTVAAGNSNGRITLALNNRTVAKSIPVPDTRQNWKEVDINGIELEPGQHIFRMYIEEGDFKIKSIRFTRSQNPGSENVP